jgi:hypothetical protein
MFTSPSCIQTYTQTGTINASGISKVKNSAVSIKQFAKHALDVKTYSYL